MWVVPQNTFNTSVCCTGKLRLWRGWKAVTTEGSGGPSNGGLGILN
jgi:hypothetical protein